MVETLGLVSGALSALSILPQIYKNFRSGSSSDISTSTILCAYIALSMGTIYGFMIDHVAVYVSDLTIIGFYVVLHVVKIRNDMKRRGGRTESVPWDPVGNRVLSRPGSLEPLDPTRTEDDQVCVNATQVRPEA